MNQFRAFKIRNENGTVSSGIVDSTLDELSPGDVVVKVAFSSVNYKDALAATPAGRIVRKFPIVGGIDLAGTVVAHSASGATSSPDGRFVAGADVIATGYGLGVSHDGGYAEYARVPADWLVPLPDGLSLSDAMVLGTAGFTAGLAVVRLERHGLTPGGLPVVVTGATGGVGSIAVAVLARAGYRVTAITGKADEHDYLRRLGAAEILDRGSLQMGSKPLEKALWAGAVDVVGGETLAWLTRTMDYGGVIASTGLTGGTDLRTTVMPFILRGVALLGIDSVMCPMPERVVVWRRLAADLRPAGLDLIGRRIGLAELPEAFSTVLAGGARGRFVVDLQAASTLAPASNHT